MSAWSITPFNPRFLKGGFIANPEGLAQVIKAALSKKELGGQRRVIASLPAFHSVSRPLAIPGSPELRPDVAIPQQARREMGYSPESSLLFWQPLGTMGGKRRYLVLSVPKEPVITLIDTLKLAGLKPDKIETSSFALARAVNQTQSIIAAVEPNSLDVVITDDCLPVAIQSTFFGEEPMGIDALPSLLTDALERIITFYNDTRPVNPLSGDTPLYLFGSLLSASEIASAVETSLGHPISDFQPPLLYPPDFPRAEMAINIGLVLKEL
ncbi:MAG: hypothetical protein DDT27_01609 [Dehalococcoidia bacterium]|nr:hypothetical protein [Chloroflexota bacterium]MBT9163040.1 hypothetical protein [Chloroflexota bacterium]